MRIQLTVYFEDPFWVGLFERRDGESLSVSRVVLGTSEPRDWEVYRWVLEGFDALRFSEPRPDEAPGEQRQRNPKRLQREAQRELAARGPSSRTQEALRLELEARKQVRRVVTREQRLAEEQRRFELRQEKRKKKHRGH